MAVAYTTPNAKMSVALPPTATTLKRKRAYFAETPTHIKTHKRVDGSRSIKVINVLCGRHSETVGDWVKTPLREDQQHAVQWMIRTSNDIGCAVLAAEMGFGKTLTTLFAITTMWLSLERKAPSLILVSKTIQETWRKQFYTHFADEARESVVFVEPQTLKNVEKIDPFRTLLVVATYESIQSRRSNGARLRDMHWNVVALDEGHCVRNVSTKRSEFVRGLKFKHIWALTGTPLQNTVVDIAALLALLGAYEIEGKLTKSALRKSIDRNPGGLFLAMRRSCLRISDIDGFDSCELREYINARPFTDEEQLEYDRRIQARFNTGDDDGNKNRLGWFSTALHSCARSSAKLEMITKIINKFVDENGKLKRKVIIFATSKEMQDRIYQHCLGLGYRTGLIKACHSPEERIEVVNQIAAGVFDIGVFSRGACSYGLNAQCASVTIFADMAGPAPQPFRQAIMREYRPGQLEPAVDVFYCVISGTIEAHIPALHRIKLELGDAICASMPGLDCFRPDGTVIVDSEVEKTAYIEYSHALQLEKKCKKNTAGGFSLSSSKQVQRLVHEIQNPTDYVNGLIASYGVSEAHESYLLGNASFDEDESDELERERILAKKTRRDAKPTLYASTLQWTPIKAGTPFYARLCDEPPANGVMDNWFGCRQMASGLFFDARIDDQLHAKIALAKDAFVLRFDAVFFNEAFGQMDDPPTYEEVSMFLRFVMRKITRHAKIYNDAHESISRVAGQFERDDVLGICAETPFGTVYALNREEETELRRFFDRTSVEIVNPDHAKAQVWDGFLDGLFD